jgi:hypothetical protein
MRLLPLCLLACVPEAIDAFPDAALEDDTVVDTVDETADTAEEVPEVRTTSRGTSFWLGYMDNINPMLNGDPEFSIVVSSEVDTTGELVAPLRNLRMPFSVEAGTATEVFLPAIDPLRRGSGTTTDFGLQITTEDPVAVSAVHYRVYFTDASLVLPESELGHDYTAVAVTDQLGNSPSQLLVVATRDDTVLTVQPKVETVDGKPANVPYEVTLQRGQTWQLQSVGDLSGTRIRTDPSTPIAVFGGARQASVSCSTADSHVWDQVPPRSRLGTDYVAMPFGEQGGDPVTVVATEAGTQLRVDCGAAISLEAGEVWTGRVVNATRFTANKPIVVGQTNESQDCNPSGVGDPSFQVLTPFLLTSTDRSWIALPNPRIWQSDPFADTTPGNPDQVGGALSVHWLNVVGTGVVEVDGEEITMFDVPDRRGWKWAQVAVDPGEHRVESDEPFLAHAYGFASYDVYTYHLGWDCTDCLADLQLPTTCP